MPYASGSYSTGESAAFNADNPLVVAHNVLLDAVDARWTESGTQTGQDFTSPVHYAYRAYDGRVVSPTRSYSTTATIYFNVQIEPSTIDTCAVVFLHPFASSTVTVQIADDSAFTSNVATFAGAFSSETGIPRIARSFGGTRYTSVEYVRIRFVKDSGSWNSGNIPKITEFYLGQGRILGLGWDYGSDLDPIYVEAAEFDARSGDRTRYIAHKGRHRTHHSQVLSEGNKHGLDDVATVRTIAEESLGYTRPVLYIPRPSSQVDHALIGYLPEGGIDLPQDDYELAGYRFEFDEIPLYRELEG